jgi:hypothetical protein
MASLSLPLSSGKKNAHAILFPEKKSEKPDFKLSLQA